MSSLISPVSLEGAMADNNTHPFVEILESFGLSKIFYHLYTLYKELSLANTQINSQCYKVIFVLLKKSEECRKCCVESFKKQKCRL